MIPLVWLQAGCGRAPEARLVEPSEVLAGEPLRVVGQDLGAASVRLGDRDLPTEDRGDSSLLARVPADTPAGRHRVALVDDRGVHPTGLEVAVIADTGCAGDFRSNTRISVVKRTVDLDRFWPDGRRQRWTLAAGDVSRVEVERTPMPDGTVCSAIFLRRSAGGRLLYDDDAAADLTERAHTVGEMLNLPVTGNP